MSSLTVKTLAEKIEITHSFLQRHMNEPGLTKDVADKYKADDKQLVTLHVDYSSAIEFVNDSLSLALEASGKVIKDQYRDRLHYAQETAGAIRGQMMEIVNRYYDHAELESDLYDRAEQNSSLCEYRTAA